MGLIMIKLKKILKEGYVWDRKFGEPLPTLNSILDKANEDHSGCTEDVCTCEDVNEGPDDKREARRVLSKIAKTEQKFRKEMFELEQVFLQDPRTENKKAARDLKKSYKDGVTEYMRDAVQMIKRMK